MTKERIDTLFKLFEQEDIDEIIEFSGIQNSEKYFDEELENAVLDLIASEVEESNEEEYEYFIKKEDSSVIDIVEHFKDKEKIKEYIEDNSKLSQYNEINLVKATKDLEYIKKYIINNQDLPNNYISDLVKSTGNLEYMKQFVEKNPDLEKTYVIDLLIRMKDSNYIKQFIEENSNLYFNYKLELIKSIGDVKYVKQYIEENSDLYFKYKLELIELIGDVKYVEQYIKENPDLDISDKIQLVKSTKDLEYIKQYIKENPNLDISDKIQLVKSTKNVEYIKKYMKENPDLDSSYKIQLLNQTITKEEMGQYIKSLINQSKRDSEITLPENITIGIEIESENHRIPDVARLLIYPNGWKVKGDGSLNSGTEVVSPILHGTKDDTEHIYEVCDILKTMGQETSDRCGGHVHIGAQSLYDGGQEAITNFLTIYSNTEDLIYIIGNAEDIKSRDNIMAYAKPISQKISEISNDGSIELNSSEDVDKFVDELKKNNSKDDRYQGLNLTNIGKENKNTIEFRISNGTVDAKTWIENINLYGGLISAAREITGISKKVETGIELTEDESFKMECFEKLQKEDISQEERLETLVGLEFKTEEQRDVYRKRYEKNKDLVVDNKTERKQPIVFKTKDIGKKTLPETNKDEIDSSDRRIGHDIQERNENYKAQ